MSISTYFRPNIHQNGPEILGVNYSPHNCVVFNPNFHLMYSQDGTGGHQCANSRQVDFFFKSYPAEYIWMLGCVREHLLVAACVIARLFGVSKRGRKGMVSRAGVLSASRKLLC
jgi:hypothetical protein